MSDLDEGRDLHAAFGTLLVDEPAAPWSVSDDVTRGRALQRRRRTRAGAGIGLAAAAVMVFGVFGPLRPQAAVVAPPAYQPPAVKGVDQAWLTALDRAFTGFNGPVVDWSRSTVTPTAGGGFTLDLTLVGATVTSNGDDATIEYAEPPGPPVARAFVTWNPAGGEGPVLASCAAPACVRSEASVSPGFTNEGARWDADGAQVAGTFVVDQTYTDGAMLELASSPVEGSRDGWATLNFGGITYVLDRVGRPGAPSQIEGDDAVAQVLESLGWTVDGATVQRVPVGLPTETTWTVSQPGTDGTTNTGRLTVRAWTARSWQVTGNGVKTSSVIAGCATAGSCTDVLMDLADCGAAAGCWSSSTATTKAAYTGLPEGSFLLYRFNELSKLAVELVVEPLVCITCNASPMPPFLTPVEAGQLAVVVQEALESGPSPSITPTPPAPDDAVARTLAGFGMRVMTMAEDQPTVNPARTYTVDVDRTADKPVSAVLTLTRFDASTGAVGTERVAPDGVVMNGCTSTTCTPVQNVTFPCPTTACIQDWWAITTPAYTGLDQGTLVVFRSDGTNAVEAVVGVKSCPTCGQAAGSGLAFLTLEQTQAVLTAFGLGRGGTVPGPSSPPAIGVVDYLAGKGITTTGGPDFAGKGPVGDGGSYAGEYLLSVGSRESSVRVALDLGRSTTSDAVACADTCRTPPSTTTGTDSGGLGYTETQVVQGAASPYGPAGTRVVERVYGDLLMRLVIEPWRGSDQPLLAAAQATLLADAFAVDARAAAGVPAVTG